MTPAPPAGLGTSGEALWRALHDDFDLAQHEQRLLIEACRTADLLDALAAAVAADGVIDADGKVHPAAVEARQQRVVLTRMLASLRIPDGDGEDGDGRPQRRGGARGAYRPRST